MAISTEHSPKVYLGHVRENGVVQDFARLVGGRPLTRTQQLELWLGNTVTMHNGNEITHGGLVRQNVGASINHVAEQPWMARLWAGVLAFADVAYPGKREAILCLKTRWQDGPSDDLASVELLHDYLGSTYHARIEHQSAKRDGRVYVPIVATDTQDLLARVSDIYANTVPQMSAPAKDVAARIFGVDSHRDAMHAIRYGVGQDDPLTAGITTLALLNGAASARRSN